MQHKFQMTRTLYIATQIVKFLLRTGLPMGPLRLLAHQGRKSGTLYETPVALVTQGNTSWLVSPFGEVNWVKNIRANNGETVLRQGWRKQQVTLVELDTTTTAPILKRFLQAYRMIPFIPPYFDATPNSPIAEFERESDVHPAFRIEKRV